MEISVYQLHLESDRFQFMLRKGHKFQKRSTHLIYRVVLSRKQQTHLLFTLFNVTIKILSEKTRTLIPKLKTDLTTFIKYTV